MLVRTHTHTPVINNSLIFSVELTEKSREDKKADEAKKKKRGKILKSLLPLDHSLSRRDQTDKRRTEEEERRKKKKKKKKDRSFSANECARVKK